MAAKKKKAIIYIKRDRLIISVENNLNDHILEFGTELVSNEEIVNEEMLSKTVSDFFIRNGIYINKFIAVLDDEILFYKDLSSINEYYRASLINEFIGNIPFEKNKIFIKTLGIEDSFYVIAANKVFVKTVIRAIEETECNNIGILPYFLIHNYQAPFRLFKDKKLLNQLNLLRVEDARGDGKLENINKKEPEGSTDTIKPKKEKKHNDDNKKGSILKNIFLIFLTLILFGFAGGWVYFYYINYQKENNLGTEVNDTTIIENRPVQDPVKEVSDTTEEKITEEEIPAEEVPDVEEVITKDITELKLLVLNGTGVPGLASKTKSSLVELGFAEDSITVGNALINSETNLYYVKEVADKDLDSISTYLSLNFDTIMKTLEAEKIIDKSGDTNATFDVIIITGLLIDNQSEN
jgi:hypothetical protein